MTMTSPYRGLAPYGDSEDDAQLFFGRERDTEIVVANLIASRLTVLYGASGVGKSSLLRAAVARQLRELPERPVVIVHGSWRDVTLGVLAEAVEPGGRGSFARRVLAAARERDVYLILDQVEELILYHGDDARLRREAVEVLEEPARVNLLLSIRDDALAELDRFKAALPGIYGNAVRLDRLDRAGGRAAIMGPVERWNELHGTYASVEPELVEAVLDGVGEGEIDLGRGRGVVAGAARAGGIEAPFLQLVMQRLWQESSSRGEAAMTRQLLDGLGGTGRVVADHLAGALAQLSADQRDVAAEMFHHLVTPGGSKILHELGDLATYAGRSQEDAAPVLETLAEHRIVRRHADESGRERYEIFHDVLATPVLAWRAEHVAESRFQQALAEGHRRRVRLQRLVGIQLAVVIVLLGLTLYALDRRSDASRRAREASARALSSSAVTVAAVDPELSLLLAAEAVRLASSPQTEVVLRRALRESRVRAIVPLGGAGTAVAVSPRTGEVVVTSRDGAARLLSPQGARVVRVLGHDAPVTGAAYSEEGHYAVTWGEDGTARLWPSERGFADITVRHGGKVASAWASALVDRALTAGGRTVRMSVIGGKVLWTRTFDGPVRVSAVGVAGAVVAVGLDGRQVLVLDGASGRLLRRLEQDSRPERLAFLPDGRLAVATADGEVAIWDPGAGRLLMALGGPGPAIVDLDVDDRGRRLLVTRADGTVRIDDAQSGRELLAVTHTGGALSAAFSRGGAFVVTTGRDRGARVWDAAGGRLLALLVGHRGAVADGAFTLDGLRVVTASRDGTVRVWDAGTRVDLRPAPGARRLPVPRLTARSPDGSATATTRGALVQVRRDTGVVALRGHVGDVTSVAFSPGGRAVVTASRDGSARIWDAAKGIALVMLQGHLGAVVDARFSPDGRFVVTAGPVAAGLWDAATGDLIALLHGPRSPLVAAAFVGDGRTIVTLEQDGAVRGYRCGVCGTADELLALADARLAATGRRLTADERARYVP